MIGIIGAMSEEVEALKTLMCVKKEEKKLDFYLLYWFNCQ